MAKGALLYQFKSDLGTVTAGHAVATLPAANLQDPQLATRWRTPYDTVTSHVLVDLGASTAVDTVVLIAANLTASATRRVRVSTADATGVAGDAHDSGTGAGGIYPEQGKLIYLLSGAVNGRYVRVDLVNTGGYWIEAGRLLVGARWTPAHNYRIGWRDMAIDDSQVLVTWGGQEWRDGRAIRRRVQAELPALTEAEVSTHGDALARLGGARDVLLILDTASTDLGRDTVFGRLAPVTMTNVFLRRRSLTLDITERK